MPSKNETVTGGARATIDHDKIREWVEEHGGHPAAVKRTHRGKTPGILRIDFPGFSGEGKLEPISWEEFFERFEESQLAFLHQDRTKTGRPSRFNKLVSRDTVELAPARRGRAASRSRTPSLKAPRATRTRQGAQSEQRPKSRATKARSTGSSSTAGRRAATARSTGTSRRSTSSTTKPAAVKTRTTRKTAARRSEREAPVSRTPATKKRVAKKSVTKTRVPVRSTPRKRSRSSAH